MQAVPSDRRTLILTLGALSALGAASIDMYLPALPSLAEQLPGPAGEEHLRPSGKWTTTNPVGW